jgi:uncharacterized repeat protein (TIGR03843 family)
MYARARTATGSGMADASASRRAWREQQARGGRPARRQSAGHESGGGESGGTPAQIDGVARHPTSARDEAEILDLLATGTLDVKGRLVDASNATMYCTIASGGIDTACVYKPVAGERPLWDFPDGTLAGRELAAYVVSRAAGFDVVPPTVYRDGPFGHGMCQLWIDADETADLVELARSTDTRLRQMAVFDAVVNNADRKIGHLLPVADGPLYGCDHGVCFGSEYKLRTVLWQWRGQRLTAEALATLASLRELLTDGDLAAELRNWLTPTEVAATLRRVEMLLARKVHPLPPVDWPAVPWPPI